MTRTFLLMFTAFALLGCKEELASARPTAVTMTEDALGFYCQMSLDEHPGPKAQVHLDGSAFPIFFAQVRDAVAYQRMPEQSHAITAIYVSDMGVAESWERPGASNWIPLDDALLVVGSSAVGGMGAAELVPFGTRDAALDFVRARGGQIAAADAIGGEDVLAPVTSEGDPDYTTRLKALNAEDQG